MESFVGVADAQSGQNANFQGFHAPGLGGRCVIVAEQMQYAVDGQVRPVLARALALFGGFAGDNRRANHQVAEQAGRF